VEGRHGGGDERSDTRELILQVASALFARPGGYRATSMRQIAERVGVTKAALYHHFRSKDDILDRLTEPLLGELEAALDMASAESELAAVRWRVVEGCVETMLAHRAVLAMLLRDLALLSGTRVGSRLAAVMARGQDLLAGPSAGLGQRIRAFQLTSGLANTITRFADVPAETLRVHLLDGARVVLDGLVSCGPDPAERQGVRLRGRPRGRAGGRPPALGAGDIALARRRYRAGEPVERIAAALGVSRATVYRHLNGNSET
jgi:AcrR family transcriptional regulator